MNQQTKVTGVILAGGLARRMQNQDKGLIPFRGKPMISYAIAAMQPVVDSLLINANRNLECYQKFGFPVISDATDSFDGPLAGVLTAMQQCTTALLLVMPCDSPLLATADLQRLLNACAMTQADIAVAFDGQRLHPVFFAVKCKLQESLAAYLGAGQRKIDRWFEQHSVTQVDFSDKPDIFRNINTLAELSKLEADSE